MDTVNTAEQSETFYGVFNKHTGVFYTFEKDKNTAYNYCNKNFVIKEIQLKPFEYYWGDYETGQVYNENIKPLIREDELERKLYEEIALEYSFFKQLCILTEVLAKNEEILKTDEFNSLAKFIKIKKLRFEQGLKTIKESKNLFNFVSKDEIKELDRKRIQGFT